ncbi:phage tail protein [Pseudomonas sp. NPDC090233]|uniref:phage tail protein n=1 Tax=Pseudomonas sp. NPDC090233 TaxID=3364479 RepID=UPI003839D70E
MAFGRTGVAAGTYRSVQVDKYGRVVSATNPSTVAGYGITDVYTKAETFTKAEVTQAIATSVASAVAGLVDSSPGALDTLKELATAIGNDPNFANTVLNELAKKAPLVSPKLSGTPEAPTAAVGTNTNQIATMAALLQGMASFGLGSSAVPTISDFNAPVTTGFFKAVGSAVNSPYPSAANTILLLNIQYSTTASFQIAGVATSTQANMKLFWRGRNSTFAEWRDVATSESPIFTGNPTAPTAAVGDNDTSIATTAFVQSAIKVFGIGSISPTYVTDIDDPTLSNGLFGIGTATVSGTKPAGINWALLSVTGRNNLSGAQGRIVQTLYGTDTVNARVFARSYFGASNWSEWRETAYLDSPSFTGDPKAPTPSAGDNDTSIATTAFVQTALQSLRNGLVEPRGYIASVNISADTVLNGGSTGTLYRVTASNLTITLPEGSGIINGRTIALRNESTGQLTLKATSGTLRWAAAMSGTSLPLAANESVELVSAGNDWIVNNRSKLVESAPLDSPSFAGSPRAISPPASDSSTRLATTNFVSTAINDFGVPPGMVGYFAMASPPTGWLKRNGAVVSRTTYARLFAAIGTTFGAGDGSTTFSLPDARGSFDRGWDDGRNLDKGRTFGSPQQSANLSHGHGASMSSAGGHSHTINVKLDRGPGTDGNAIFGDEPYYGEGVLGTDVAGAHTHTITVSASGENEARPYNVAYLACIKY